MSPEIVTALIAGVVGLLTGAIGSLIAPWVNWGIEKRRKRHENRANLINTWQAIIANPKFDRARMTTHPSYGTLMPLLTPAAVKQLHRPGNSHIVVQGSSDPTHADRMLLQREIARIEGTWRLV
jgi:hypothetical protein